MVRISESGMVFGEYAEENVFQIEKSKLHDKIGNGIKVVEFILMSLLERLQINLYIHLIYIIQGL